MSKKLLILNLLLLITVSAQAQEYREEITRYVVDPCYLDMIAEQNKTNPLSVSDSEMLELIKTMEADAIGEMIISINDIAGKIDDYATRKDLYDMFYTVCRKRFGGHEKN